MAGRDLMCLCKSAVHAALPLSLSVKTSDLYLLNLYITFVKSLFYFNSMCVQCHKAYKVLLFMKNPFISSLIIPLLMCKRGEGEGLSTSDQICQRGKLQHPGTVTGILQERHTGSSHLGHQETLFHQ